MIRLSLLRRTLLVSPCNVDGLYICRHLYLISLLVTQRSRLPRPKNQNSWWRKAGTSITRRRQVGKMCHGHVDAPTHALSKPTTVPRSLGKFLTLVTKQAVSNQVPPLQVKPAMIRTSQKGVAINLHKP